MRLEKRVAIVTGGGTGIGAAIAGRFAREGASLVVTGRRPEPIEEIARQTGAVPVAGDAADPAHIADVVATALDRFGRLDVVRRRVSGRGESNSHSGMPCRSNGRTRLEKP